MPFWVKTMANQEVVLTASTVYNTLASMLNDNLTEASICASYSDVLSTQAIAI